MLAWIGIDPGKLGACVLYREDEVLEYIDWSDNLILLNQKLEEWDRNYKIMKAVVEDVQLGGTGYAGVTKLAQNKGIWIGLVVSKNWSLELVKPQKWMKKTFVKADGKLSKKRSVNKACQFWPKAEIFFGARGGLKDGRAEAALMAKYGKEL